MPVANHLTQLKPYQRIAVEMLNAGNWDELPIKLRNMLDTAESRCGRAHNVFGNGKGAVTLASRQVVASIITIYESNSNVLLP